MVLIFLKKIQIDGQFAFANKTLIKKLCKSRETKLAIMINGADFLKIKNDYKKFLDKNFKNNTSSFSIIRIAAHYNDVDKILKYVKYLKKLGFKICLNLMQINNVTKKILGSV